MSIFAGVVARSQGLTIPDGWKQELRAAISRNGDDQEALSEIADEKIFMLKVDVGAYREVGEIRDDSQQGFLAGDPLIAHRDMPPPPRSESLRAIGRDVAANGVEALRQCRGQFCAAIYQTADSTLHLVVDKLGVRPIYVWMSQRYLVFASALRIIESLKFCDKELDLRGISEIASFGFALSDRTAYRNVFAMNAAEHLTLSGGDVVRQKYWRWDESVQHDASGGDSKQRVWDAFRDAIRIRLRGDKSAAAFLSGGLDSRSIVATLRAEGAELTTCNFAPPDSQDEVFGALASKQFGTQHSYLWRSTLGDEEAYSKSTVLEWSRSASFLERRIERPALFWSGDGGSVGLGHVYLNRRIVEASRAGRIDEAIQEFLRHNKIGVGMRLFKKTLGLDLQNHLIRGIKEELAQLHPADTGRAFYLFLMLNDQRRHLAGHFENLDLSRIDFHLPFFDSEFLGAVMREPIDGFLYHTFYVDWLKLLPDGVRDIPWQAYPGHVPCPIPAPAGLRYQWGEQVMPTERKTRMRNTTRRAGELLRDKAFSNAYLSSMQLRAFIWLVRLGLIEGREYLLTAPRTLHKYWRRAGANGGPGAGQGTPHYSSKRDPQGSVQNA